MNPFIERDRITNPQRFAGRWRELSIIFDRLETHRPVLITGSPAIGKSSLLTHIVQSAAIAMEQLDLRAYYVDLAVLTSEVDFYELVVKALQNRGNTAAALEVALLTVDGPVLLCLDNADAAITAGWGELLLERLVRMVRSRRARRVGDAAQQGNDGVSLMLVAAVTGPAPQLSEPFAALNLGAFAPAEVRLVAEAYLDSADVAFSPEDLHNLADLSARHPAYLQRAAFHLFQAKIQPGYDWRAAYRQEVRERPIPGAALPPSMFESERGASESILADDDQAEITSAVRPEALQSQGMGGFLVVMLTLAMALIVFQASGNWWLAGGTLVAVLAVVVTIERRRTKPEL